MRKISTYYANDGRGRAEVHFDFKSELAYVQYFDDNGRLFFTEEFPDRSLHYVEDAAVNWAIGIKKLE